MAQAVRLQVCHQGTIDSSLKASVFERANPAAVKRRTPEQKTTACRREKATSNASVVRINGNITCVGAPTLSSYDIPRFGARVRVFEACKGCVVACFGAC